MEKLLICSALFACLSHAMHLQLDENVEDKESRIVGGGQAKVGEFPWQVSLQRRVGNGKWDHFCGGSILDETHIGILTAAHCIDNAHASQIRVVAGAANIFENESTQQRLPVKVIRGNPKYHTGSLDYDSAVLHLGKPLVFNERVTALGLAPEEHEPKGHCVASGWGDINRLGIGWSIFPNSLQKIDIYIVDRNLCRIPYLLGTVSWVTSNMICANAFLGGTCSGDSGGPLVCYDMGNATHPVYYLAGITSFGADRCANLLYPSVFTNVARQRKFIDSELRVTYITLNKNTTNIFKR